MQQSDAFQFGTHILHIILMVLFLPWGLIYYWRWQVARQKYAETMLRSIAAQQQATATQSDAMQRALETLQIKL